MLEVRQLEDLGWDGGETVAVEPKNLQTAREVGEAARLQWWDTIVVEEPEEERFINTVCIKYKDGRKNIVKATETRGRFLTYSPEVIHRFSL